MAGKKILSRKEFLKKSASILIGASALGNKKGIPQSKILPGKSTSTRILGRTDLKVTPLGYGASRTMEPSLVEHALNKGINFFDTGRSYFQGRNEMMVGKILKEKRHSVVIQSKISLRIRESGEELKISSVRERIHKDMSASLEASLKALQTDLIDIMLLHGVRSEEILHHESILSFFEKAKKDGKIRAHGFSSHANSVAVLRASVDRGFYDVAMIPYNHKGSYVHSQSGRYSEWDQEALEKELEKASQKNMGLIAMKTCSAGPLSPKKGGTPSFLEALKWVIDRPAVHTSAVAMANFSEIEEDTSAMFS
ncbi:MAG: aldo/keto reductase [Candidatus Aminicenantes bacterium]|nr:aldo/keto reductase [Candidatus Aminicenantes bacterium]